MTKRLGYGALRRLFLLAVASCGGSVTSTTGGGETSVGRDAGAKIDRTLFDTAVCEGDVPHAPLEGVTPGSPVDYLELRVQNEFSGGDDENLPTVRAEAATGQACKTATDATQCRAALEALRTEEGWRLTDYGMAPPQHRFLVYTRGDEVGSVTTLTALSSFLAPVEHARDAALIASERGHRTRCGVKNARKTQEGFELVTETGHACGQGTGIDENVVKVSTTGEFTVVSTVRIKDGDPQCAIGRRPEGFVARGSGAESAVGRYFAEIAELEAASVTAFQRLAEELAHHGAPVDLIARARASARDEVRHTTYMTALASRYGAVPSAVLLEKMPARDLFALALENAVEGCVRETFGALQATFQAARAEDPAVKRVMTRIAEDETRHAALAWAIAAWAEPRLEEEERFAIECARVRAIEALAAALRTEPDPAVAAVAGAPTAADSESLLDAVAWELWAVA